MIDQTPGRQKEDGRLLTQLTGARVIHEAALISIGAPTANLVMALARAWSLPAELPPSYPLENRYIRCHARAVWREVPKGPTISFKPADLRWERGRFELTFYDRERNQRCEIELELDLGQERILLRVPDPQRDGFLKFLSGELPRAQLLRSVRIGIPKRLPLPWRADASTILIPRRCAATLGCGWRMDRIEREEWIRFLQWALPQLRLEWAGFRKVRGQCIKRIRRRMIELGLDSIAEYRDHLQAHAEEWSALDELCRITISRFWRDRAVFEALRSEVFPALLAADRSELSVWSAGCASGEEPYSVALAWRFGPTSSSCRLRILGTDVNEAVLERARRAIYPRGTLRELPPSWIERAFIERDGELELRLELRESVELERRDLRGDLPEETFAVILCRNLVLTYFEPALQIEVLGRIIDHLEIDGALVVGVHERVPAALAHRLMPWDRLRCVYRRVC